MLGAFRIALASRRGLRIVAVQSLIAFGAISAVVQLYTAIWVPDDSLPHALWLLLAVGGASLAFGVAKAWPRREVEREFATPDLRIRVKVADIFSESGQLVVGFADTFDTDTTDDLIIASHSLQGQLLARRFDGDTVNLDRQLAAALHDVRPESWEAEGVKKGKVARYPVGTVAVLGRRPAELIYAVAYTRMSNDLVAKSSVHDLWLALGELWDAAYKRGQRNPIVMPVVGTKLARINCLDMESLLKMAILSFISRSREELICNDLTIVVHPSDEYRVNMHEVTSFFRAL